MAPASKVSAPPTVVMASCVSSAERDLTPAPMEKVVAFECPTNDVQAHVNVEAFIKVKVAVPWIIIPAIVVAVIPYPVVKFAVAGVAVVIVEADPK